MLFFCDLEVTFFTSFLPIFNNYLLYIILLYMVVYVLETILRPLTVYLKTGMERVSFLSNVCANRLKGFLVL